jgi:hypothetical protein
MSNWNTIHLFGYGESQIISKTSNNKVAIDKLTTVAPLLTYLSTIQQEGTTISPETMHVLSVFNGLFVDFFSNTNENKLQRFEWSNIDTNYIDALATQISENVTSSLSETTENAHSVIVSIDETKKANNKKANKSSKNNL